MHEINNVYRPAPIAVVTANAIRSIVSPADPGRQLLQVLDDGDATDPCHSVLRACDGVTRADATEARRQLLQRLRYVELDDPQLG